MLFNKIIGQELPKSILSRLFEQKHFPPLLFVGPKGVGKRTMAINFAQIINCPQPTDIETNDCQRCRQISNLNYLDVKLIFPIPQKRTKSTLRPFIESDSSEETSFTSVIAITEEEQVKEYEKVQNALSYIGQNLSDYALDKIRPDLPSTNFHPIEIIKWLKSEMSYAPVIGRNKIIIIIDADRMRIETANALLKTLEEPQIDTLFILTTEKISTILPTIRSRCQIVTFSYLAPELITQYLIRNKNIDPTQAQIAAQIAEGSLRKALLFISDQNTFLPEDNLIKLLDRDETLALNLLHEILYYDRQDIPLEKIISSLLLIYRSALYKKINLPTVYDHKIIHKIKTKLSLDQLISRLTLLVNALQDTTINLNRKLFLFSIFTSLRI